MDDTAPPTRGYQIVSIALALMTASALAYASVSYAWAVDPIGGHAGYGLRACQVCLGAECVTVPFVSDVPQDVKPPVRAWPPSSATRAFGWVTSVASWIAAGTLVLASVLVAMGRLFFRPIAATTLALLALVVGLIAGCVFVAQAREIGTVGWTFWLFGVATVVGIVAAQRLARFKPGDPFWDAPPPVTDDPDKW